MTDQLSDAEKQQIATLATTEHFTLQTARSATISDANGRASLFLSTVSSTLVALAFVGQVDESMSAFFIFSFVLFPTLIFLGVATFARVLQSAIEDTIYAREINRLRHLYAELSPILGRYFLLSTNDDAASIIRTMGVTSGRWQMFLTTAGTIGVINSTLVGVLVGLVCSRLGLTVLLCAGAGIAAFIAGIVLHLRYQTAQWQAVDVRLPVLFPADTSGDPH
ncbi:MAG: hypothetical protein H7Z42_10410 [Roseiflexaceae bacterium]|nr:hypothetical protein [Roseiflexaceae bacterium]